MISTASPNIKPASIRRGAKPNADLFQELIVDNFAGAGGASKGIEAAIGRCVDIAINHDRHSVHMHQVNHPHTRHLCEDVWDVNPAEATAGRRVGLAWFSPDCKHFSRAKGGKPVEKKIRGLAWIVVKWAKLVKPRVIILENVREFQEWGPLTDDSRPCPKRRGSTEPMPTVTAGGNHLAEVRAFLTKYYGNGDGQAVDQPLHTVTTKDRLGVVAVHGHEYQIVDIGLRMLQPLELLRARFGKHAKGYVLIGTKSQQVAGIGNSVPPDLAEAMVRANYCEKVEVAA